MERWMRPTRSGSRLPAEEAPGAVRAAPSYHKPRWRSPCSRRAPQAWSPTSVFGTCSRLLLMAPTPVGSEAPRTGNGAVGTRHEYPAAASARKPSTGARSSSSPILSYGRYARSVHGLRIGLAQIAPRLGELEANLERHHALIADARRQDVGLVVFPELGLTGYLLQDLASEVAMRLDDPRLGELAAATS